MRPAVYVVLLIISAIGAVLGFSIDQVPFGIVSSVAFILILLLYLWEHTFIGEWLRRRWDRIHAPSSEQVWGAMVGIAEETNDGASDPP
jgi:hypothetical protein